MIFNSENSLILRILIQTKCHKIPGSVLIYSARASTELTFLMIRVGKKKTKAHPKKFNWCRCAVNKNSVNDQSSIFNYRYNQTRIIENSLSVSTGLAK